MTTPRQPDGPYGRGRDDRGTAQDPYDRDPYTGDPYYRDPYDRAGQGAYDSEPEYGWQQPEYAPAGSYGPGHAPGYGSQEQAPRRSRPVTPRTPSRRATRQRRKPPWLAAAAAGVVIVAFLVLGFVAPGWFVTRVLDATAVQNGVAKILTDDYGAEGVADVHCPDRVQVTVGTTFTCDAAIDGDPVKVPVRVTGADGGYQVGRPT
jgi:Domain of unknown function (DUF4333)